MPSNKQIAGRWLAEIKKRLSTYDIYPTEFYWIERHILCAITEATKELQGRVEGLKRAHDDAYICGLEAYAWWKDGVQYVGTTGTTLKHAIQLFQNDEAFMRHPLMDYSPTPAKSHSDEGVRDDLP